MPFSKFIKNISFHKCCHSKEIIHQLQHTVYKHQKKKKKNIKKGTEKKSFKLNKGFKIYEFPSKQNYDAKQDLITPHLRIETVKHAEK